MSDKNNLLIPIQNIDDGVDQFTDSLNSYLDYLGLPSNDILVPVNERRKVIQNLPHVIEHIPSELKNKAAYISKFIAAIGAGLFDAALNFIWDETINNLRDKVSRFDLEYFYNSVITDSDRRNKFQTAEDLIKLDDWELIRGCHLIGVLSDIGFKHMDYIRNMRNWASAAHPNPHKLTGLQLASWLETCIREVIAKDIFGPVIEIKKLLHNIRTTTLLQNDIGPIVQNIKLLPHDLAISLLRTLFGMYVDPNVSATVKNNIKLIAKAAWDNSPEETKHEIGLKFSVYAANADIQRRNAAYNFLELVDGLSYLPPDTLALELNEKINNLFNAHIGFNNFYNEPPHAKILVKYVPDTGKIPDAVRHNYVKTLIMCRIGNGYGISWEARPYYDRLIEKFQEEEITIVVQLISDSDFVSRLQFPECAKNYKEICQQLRDRTTNQRIISAIDKIIETDNKQIYKLNRTSEMRRILNLKEKAK